MKGCPVRGCKHGGKMNRHHLFWPAHRYKTRLERLFRNHPDNVRTICMCEHDFEHCKRPPDKPSHGFMKRWLAERT